jgi:hypothetical protein
MITVVASTIVVIIVAGEINHLLCRLWRGRLTEIIVIVGIKDFVVL